MSALFMPSELGEGLHLGPSVPIFQRQSMMAMQQIPAELQQSMDAILRGEFTGDANQVMAQYTLTMAEIQRAITSATSGFPVREDLEAPARELVPVETPLRNRLPRTIGSGTASAWRQVTSFGGGYGVSTGVSSGASSATQTVTSTAGMYAGQTLIFDNGSTTSTRIVSSVTNATTVVLTATIDTSSGTWTVYSGPYFQPGQATAPVRTFFGESGAPADHGTTYASKSAGYKLLGTYFSITGFAMAAGATFQNQLAFERTNALRNLMLNEEHALIAGSSTATGAPWGDGSNALGFDGLLNLIVSGNGVPLENIQTGVGALTTTHIDAQLTRIWRAGGRGLWFMVNAQEQQSLVHLAQASGSIHRIVVESQGNTTMGLRVTKYVHPVSGEEVDVMVSRFMPAGTIIFGADFGPDGKAAADVRVLPQVQLPELAPTDNIQGYVAQELAPTTAAPQVFPGIVTVFEVLRFLNNLVWAKSSGVTAV